MEESGGNDAYLSACAGNCMNEEISRLGDAIIIIYL
jgi:hypothetical protein